MTDESATTTDWLEQLRDRPLPRHVAIIMDGNGRWAERQRLTRAEGHRKGADATKKVVRAAGKIGLAYLTLYSFSSENWGRPADEVAEIMRLLHERIEGELPELLRENVRMQFVGRLDRLPRPLIDLTRHATEVTAKNTGLCLTIAVSYGGRAEILDACQAIMRRVADGSLSPDAVTEELIAEHLYTYGTPDPDLLIRTSGEMRVSNFLLWQIAYTELYVVPTLWPEFGEVDLYRAIADFQRRTRRFGGT